ncbi:cAMP/cGMP-stimulated cAMP/cGMP phosphodiesterase [Heterostelium album PN500]|uniref:cAMP/cGMP-stimulated cAMP/cGMP phosphodiesterase n=1 Tax=Heterostelium pallidum (strain ATCC 26659 / Pp 5 / PN500) TaxID=670386 RepID=D3B4A9_HETP5|nr:cAMP/cGMP-stimulated cAMP/cGMP phosphodiesterase [Heterostelium album PN500]EFA84157.1 cAMP/cGMP-stimulated cAMP/cGMP phosphodiesterase [Heterostelium album PN500]|eukprot:XP_020436274.1 cAMP/cGMP-stimulated cAMP/cGMP phosphodiesterase [Heterostelium album PN500]
MNNSSDCISSNSNSNSKGSYNIKFTLLLEHYHKYQNQQQQQQQKNDNNVIDDQVKKEIAKYLMALIVLRTKVTALYSENIIDSLTNIIGPYVCFTSSSSTTATTTNTTATTTTSTTAVATQTATTTTTSTQAEVVVATNGTPTVTTQLPVIPFSVDHYELLSKIADLYQFGALNTKGLFAIILNAINLILLMFQSFKSYKDCDISKLNQLVNSPTSALKKIGSGSPRLGSVNTHAHAQNSYNPQILSNSQVFSELDTDQISIHYRPFINYLFECIKNGDCSEHCYSKTVRPKEQGSFLFDSVVGPIQIGVPPETIKTSLKAHSAVPQIYVLPHILCSNGVSYSEVEFPVFFNFFIKKAASNPLRRVIMVGHEDQLRRVRSIFKESMFGPNPDQIYIKEEISKAKLDAGYAIDFEAERATLAYRKHGMESSIDDFVIFKPFDQRNQVKIDLPSIENPDEMASVVIENRHGLICFYDGEHTRLKGVVDSTMSPLPSVLKQVATLSSPSRQSISNFALSTPKFIPPTFGITFLGTSHGFDPFGQTTGFIIWINGNGVLVDPPIGTSKYLQHFGLGGHLVECVILTHCHSDHDSGLLQQIVEGTKMTLYTTRTIHDSYMRKAQALTGIDKINEFYNWVPVTIGDTVRIQGADFEFDYSFHTIPTIRFKISFHGKTMSYSSDTKYCPESLSQLVKDGVINPLRESSLRIHMPPSMIYKIFFAMEPKKVTAGTVIMRAGDDSDCCYLVEHGTADVLIPTPEEMKSMEKSGFQCFDSPTMSRGLNKSMSAINTNYQNQAGDQYIGSFFTGDTFGENALSRRAKRSATVIARTDMSLLSVSHDAFLKLQKELRQDELLSSLSLDLERIALYSPFLKNVLSKTFPFSQLQLSKEQIDYFAATIDSEMVFEEGATIIKEDDHDDSIFNLTQLVEQRLSESFN